MRGCVMGISPPIFGGMIPLGSLEAGVLADFIGTSATMAIGALSCALAALLTLQASANAKRSSPQYTEAAAPDGSTCPLSIVSR